MRSSVGWPPLARSVRAHTTNTGFSETVAGVVPVSAKAEVAIQPIMASVAKAAARPIKTQEEYTIGVLTYSDGRQRRPVTRRMRDAPAFISPYRCSGYIVSIRC